LESPQEIVEAARIKGDSWELDLKDPNINFNFSISFQVFYIASLFHSTESFLKSSQGKGFIKEKHNFSTNLFLRCKNIF
jgi:hypothetical protein